MQRIHLIISGDVQGVGFRAWVVRQAKKLGVSGWVKNRDDGSVEIVAEGLKNKLEELAKLCRHGPEVSWIEALDIRWERADHRFVGFEVIY
jgi:acylphosphatase